MVGDDVRLVLDEYKSNFSTYELKPGFYTFTDLSEVLSQNSQIGFDGHNNSTDIEFIDSTMKNKLIVRPDIIALRFDEKSILALSLDSIHIKNVNIIMNTLVKNL